MNRDELTKFMHGTYFQDYVYDKYDSSGNREWSAVYEKDGKLYQLEFLNDEPYEKWEDCRHISGVYEPKEVIRKTRMVEEVYYEEVEKILRTQEEIRNIIDSLVKYISNPEIQNEQIKVMEINIWIKQLQDALHFSVLPNKDEDVYMWLVKDDNSMLTICGY